MATSTFKLSFPTKPFIVTQAWGIYNPAYKPFGFLRHNGVDFLLGERDELYAPCAGVVENVGNIPKGAGVFISIMTEKKEFADGKFNVLVELFHCKEILAKIGDVVDVGTLVAIGDNTGFSTGPHSHINVRRVKNWNERVGKKSVWEKADSNDASGTINPAEYWTGRYSKDAKTIINTLQALLELLRQRKV